MIPWEILSPQSKRHHDRLSRFRTDDRRVYLYFAIGRPFPPKTAPSHWGSGPLFNMWLPVLTQVLNPHGISIGSAIFAGLTSVTYRPTDRPRYTRSVKIDRIYVRSTSDAV